MFSPFTADTAPVRHASVEAAQAGRFGPRVTFRAPDLDHPAVITEPFTRLGPRLRCWDCFSRELSS